MKGTYFLGNGRFETREIPAHELGPKEVLLEVHSCGVCGTDVHIYHGEKGASDVNPPVILGHELSGIVSKVGKDVTKVSVGDHVTVDPNIYCGECRSCRIGKKQLCENLYAIGVNTDGGFADFCYVPESQCYVLSKDVPLEEGALTEPLACCIHGIDRLGIRPGDDVTVVGGGAIGLIMVQLARLSGASRILLSEPVAKRREIGLKVGADYAINPMEIDIEEGVRNAFGHEGSDCVIECVGNTIATAQAFKAAGRGAKVLLFSVPKPETTHPLLLDDVFHKELSIFGSLINPDTHQRAADMINSRRLDLKSIITHRFPHEKLEDAIRMQMSSESLKVVVGR